MNGSIPPDLRAKGKTLVERAADDVVDAAAEGRLLPGDRLVETDIGKRLGISRVPVREALRLLESQGIVVSEPHKGMRLMTVTNKDAAAINRVRVELETLAVRQCVLHASDAQLLPIRAAAKRYRTAAAGVEPSQVRREDRAFHAAIIEAAGEQPLLATWKNISRQVVVLWCLVHDKGGVANLAEEHERIAEAILRRDAETAEKALRAHLSTVSAIDFERALQLKLAERDGF